MWTSRCHLRDHGRACDWVWLFCCALAPVILVLLPERDAADAHDELAALIRSLRSCHSCRDAVNTAYPFRAILRSVNHLGRLCRIDVHRRLRVTQVWRSTQPGSARLRRIPSTGADAAPAGAAQRGGANLRRHSRRRSAPFRCAASLRRAAPSARPLGGSLAPGRRGAQGAAGIGGRADELRRHSRRAQAPRRGAGKLR